MAKKIRLKPGEDLSAENVSKAVGLLEDGATKKAACELLGIAYNTKRLGTIIDNYTTQAAAEKRLRAKKRGTPVNLSESRSIIEQYLTTGSMEQAAKSHFRPVSLVSKVLDTHGARLYAPKRDYFNPILLPEACIASTFKDGELVWSTRYNTLAKVRSKYAPNVYAVRILGPHSRDSYQESWELGNLDHLVKLGVDFNRLEVHYQEYQDN